MIAPIRPLRRNVTQIQTRASRVRQNRSFMRVNVMDMNVAPTKIVRIKDRAIIVIPMTAYAVRQTIPNGRINRDNISAEIVKMPVKTK